MKGHALNSSAGFLILFLIHLQILLALTQPTCPVHTIHHHFKIDSRSTTVPQLKIHQRQHTMDPFAKHTIVPFMGRLWRHDTPTTAMEFTLVTYNILAQMYTKHLKLSDMKVVDWSVRKQRLLDELKSYQSDIVCLQELDMYKKHWLGVMSEIGFDSTHVEKTGKRNGCGTFWKRDRFEKVGHLALPLEELYHLIEKHVDERFARRDVANLTLLREFESGKLMLIVNNHLAWDPEYPEVKLCQIFYVLKATHRFLRNLERNGQPVSVVLCGDFNSLPGSEVYDLITTGRATIPGRYVHFKAPLFAEGIQVTNSRKQILVNPFTPAKSAYFEVFRKEPSFTNYETEFNGTLDYVFTFEFNDVEVEQQTPLRAINALEEVSLQAVQEYTTLPSYAFPSDHIAHCVKLSW